MTTVVTSSEQFGQVKRSRVVDLVTQHPLAAFFVLADAISWLFMIPLVASAQGWIDAKLPLVLHYLTAYGPMLAAFIVTGIIGGAEGVRELLGRMFRWRVGLGWVLFSAFSLAVVFALAVVGIYVVTGTYTDLTLLGQVNYLPYMGIGAWIMWIMNSGIGEETGWRGFALPRLQKRHNALSASLILTFFWVLWHVPSFFYLDTYMKLGVSMLPMFALMIAAGSIVFTWLYNSTGGSVLMAILFHGTLNFVTASKAGEGPAAAIVSILVMVWAVVVIIVFKPEHLSRSERHVL